VRSIEGQDILEAKRRWDAEEIDQLVKDIGIGLSGMKCFL
jgi:hypothetical protein